MEKINLAAVPATEARSPKGCFRVYSNDYLTAIHLTNCNRLVVIPFLFEMKLIRLPPRAARGPYRSHSARWFFYQIITGRGEVRTSAGAPDLREGDCVMHPPGEAH